MTSNDNDDINDNKIMNSNDNDDNKIMNSNYINDNDVFMKVKTLVYLILAMLEYKIPNLSQHFILSGRKVFYDNLTLLIYKKIYLEDISESEQNELDKTIFNIFRCTILYINEINNINFNDITKQKYYDSADYLSNYIKKSYPDFYLKFNLIEFEILFKAVIRKIFDKDGLTGHEMEFIEEFKLL